MTADIRTMVATLGETPAGIQVRALLLVGFAGAFRRSELVGLDVADVEQTRHGLIVTVRRSKTDQEGAGRRVGIPYRSNPATCPVQAPGAWLEASTIVDDPLFRPINRHGALGASWLTPQSVARVVKRAASSAGLNPDQYAGHSLRSGLATAAAAAGVSERAIMATTGHSSVAMVRRYIREVSLFRENAASSVGLYLAVFRVYH